MFDNRDFVMALFAVIGAILWIIYMVINQRNIGALTQALKDTRSDSNLIDQAHALATDVVSVDTLHKALDIINTFSAFAKTLVPDQVDAAIDAADDLAAAVVNDDPVPPATFQQPDATATDSVKGVPITPASMFVPQGENQELAQQ